MKLHLVLAFALGHASASRVDPIQKVVSLIDQLQQKIIKDGEAEHKAYVEFAEWCEDTSQEKNREIKTGKAQAEDLKASIEKEESDIEDASVRIEELSSSISEDEADLKAATLIREKEHKDFEAANADMEATVDTLARAQQVLEKELGGKASFLQTPGKKLQNVVAALSKIVESSTVQTNDMASLTAFLQSQSDDSDSDSGSDSDEDADDLTLMGAPDPAAYKSKSGGILDTLADMQEKAEAEQSKLQKEEMKAKFNYDMIKQSLTDKIENEQQELADHKKAKAGAQEIKATAEGELAIVIKDLSADFKTLSDAHHDCMSKAEEFEVNQGSRKEELKALATAKKFIKEMTAFAQQKAYGGASFVQLSMKTRVRVGSKAQNKLAMGTALEAVKVIRHLASDLQSRALVQLAQRISTAFRTAQRTNDDPFVKVKEMINTMIGKLVKEAEEEAGQKAFCDKEMSETQKSKADKETDIEDLSTKIEKASATSAKLKEEVAILSGELVALAKSQSEMDELRRTEHEEFLAASADLEQGLKGLQMALKVLREYYAQDKSLMQVGNSDQVMAQESFEAQMKAGAPQSGAASGIIGLLEVAESDFSKNLEEVRSAEESAVDEYEKITQENKVTKAAKEQDVKYKTKEGKALAKTASELASDRDEVQSELDSVLEYYEKLKPQCITKAPSYEERKARREKEIAGLKNALSILEGEAV